MFKNVVGNVYMYMYMYMYVYLCVYVCILKICGGKYGKGDVGDMGKNYRKRSIGKQYGEKYEEMDVGKK